MLILQQVRAAGGLGLLKDIQVFGKRETYSHTKQSGRVMFQLEVLVRERFCPVNGRASGAVAVEEVASLDHEIFDLDSVCS